MTPEHKIIETQKKTIEELKDKLQENQKRNVALNDKLQSVIHSSKSQIQNAAHVIDRYDERYKALCVEFQNIVKNSNKFNYAEQKALLDMHSHFWDGKKVF